MSDLVYEDENYKILATKKGFQVSTKQNAKGGSLRWVQYETFFKQCDREEELKQAFGLLLGDVDKKLNELATWAKREESGDICSQELAEFTDEFRAILQNETVKKFMEKQ